MKNTASPSNVWALRDAARPITYFAHMLQCLSLPGLVEGSDSYISRALTAIDVSDARQAHYEMVRA